MSEDQEKLVFTSHEKSISYGGLRNANSEVEPHLGGNIIEGDPYTFAPGVWDYIVTRFGIRSVLDLGSGMGYSASYFYRKGLQVVAVDGMKENVERALYPTIQIDLTKDSVKSCVDFVHCQEVVEHIEEKYIDNLLSSLAAGKFILMTNALPNQKGHHHVNAQSIEYWIECMARYDCHVLVEDTNRIRKIAEEEGALFLAKTGTLYVNRRRIDSNLTPDLK